MRVKWKFNGRKNYYPNDRVFMLGSHTLRISAGSFLPGRKHEVEGCPLVHFPFRPNTAAVTVDDPSGRWRAPPQFPQIRPRCEGAGKRRIVCRGTACRSPPRCPGCNRRSCRPRCRPPASIRASARPFVNFTAFERTLTKTCLMSMRGLPCTGGSPRASASGGDPGWRP